MYSADQTRTDELVRREENIYRVYDDTGVVTDSNHPTLELKNLEEKCSCGGEYVEKDGVDIKNKHLRWLKES